jgi:hypothetical protein
MNQELFSFLVELKVDVLELFKDGGLVAELLCRLLFQVDKPFISSLLYVVDVAANHTRQFSSDRLDEHCGIASQTGHAKVFVEVTAHSSSPIVARVGESVQRLEQLEDLGQALAQTRRLL